jgi:Leucine-rich repeat (LRR) protein
MRDKFKSIYLHFKILTMKKIYFLVLILCCLTNLKAQIIRIPDAKFKARLLATNFDNSTAKDMSGNNLKIDTNNDGEIDESEALNVSELDFPFGDSFESSFSGLEYFKNLVALSIGNGALSSSIKTLDLTSLTKLKKIVCGRNSLTTLKVTNLKNLETLVCEYNELDALDTTGLTNLKELNFNGNLYLYFVNTWNTPNLESLSCTNTVNSSILMLESVPNLKELDFSGCYNLNKPIDLRLIPKLESLGCANTDISTLNIPFPANIKKLICGSNLNTLDLSSFTNLEYLNCANAKLTTLNINILTKLKYLDFSNNSISTMDLSAFINLEEINCSYNMLTTLDVSNNKKLKRLSLEKNTLKSIEISNLIDLEYLNCDNNQIEILDFKDLKNVSEIHCNNNKLKKIAVNNLTKLYALESGNNALLESIEIKNGRSFAKNGYNQTYISCIIDGLEKTKYLKYVCADDENVDFYKNTLLEQGNTDVQVNSYCSFKPGGITYDINGRTTVDTNLNGCDALDSVYPNLKLNITDGTASGSFTSNASGNYTIPIIEGTHTFTPVLENPDYFSISPTTATVTFPAQTSPFIQDFCITPNGTNPDLEVSLLPIDRARPGFDVSYKLVYKNKGNITQSGTVNLTFDDSILDLVSSNTTISSQTVNMLSWNFTNLKSFETKEILVVLNLNGPTETPVVNNGDVLNSTTTIVSLATDKTPNDNTFTLNQTVVGSFDPNDKTCLEGDIITPSLIGEYVHYLIRFENKGTYSAQNIVVKDMIDLSKFDISTLVPTSSSHQFATKISENNKVEFIFENINLPFDDADNDGYIAFKIKTKPTLKVGDSFDNEANIYFDYNFPVLTNKATSTFKTTLNTSDFEFSNYFKVYPIPVHEVLNISAIQNIEIQSIAVYDILGQLVIALPNVKDASKIDVSNLRTGNYFLNIKSDKGSSSMKFIKN